MTKIKWPGGGQIKTLRYQIKKNIKAITEGRFIVIDPGISAGYVIINKGEIEESGTITCDDRDAIKLRAQAVNELFKSENDSFDLMVVEMMRGTMSGFSLMFKVGAYMASIDAPICIEIPVNVWKAMTPKDYKKSDRGDAILMGRAILELAKEIK